MRAFLASHPVEMHGQTGHDSDGRALLYLYLEYLEYLHHSTQTTTAPKLLEESLQALPCVQGVLCVNVLKKKKKVERVETHAMIVITSCELKAQAGLFLFKSGTTLVLLLC